MENITIGQVAAACGIITVLAGFVVAIYKFIRKVILDKIEKNTENIKKLENRIDKMENEQENSKEERLILLQGVLACLKGLKEQGCNGPVTQAIKDIEAYIISKSHE